MESEFVEANNNKDRTDEFNKYAELIKECGKTFDNEILLSLYGYYKQATIGDCDIACPAFWDLKGKAKWSAWMEHKGVTQEYAMKLYISKVKKLLR